MASLDVIISQHALGNFDALKIYMKISKNHGSYIWFSQEFWLNMLVNDDSHLHSKYLKNGQKKNHVISTTPSTILFDDPPSQTILLISPHICTSNECVKDTEIIKLNCLAQFIGQRALKNLRGCNNSLIRRTRVKATMSFHAVQWFILKHICSKTSAVYAAALVNCYER